MLQLFKKRKPKADIEKSDSSLWLYNPNSYEDSLPGYSEQNNLFAPSAPTLEERSTPTHDERTYDLDCDLEIRTKLNLTTIAGVIGVLEELLDKYQGSVSYRPLLMANVLVMALHMGKKTSENSLNTYHSDMCYPVTYHLSSRYPKLKEKIEYNLSIRFKRGRNDVFMNIKCKMIPTNKRGVPFLDIYNCKMSNGASPPSFSSLASIFKINTYPDGEKIVFN
ncbi:matrix [Kamese virus]|uniref:Matrix protein n=1 Tax=Kamese virus TaxID=200402 RepID=A0A0D3R1J2_9RHAB|nr:matrix [Kamese virus]AJR28330.1 matrix [Kamese virus]ARE72401.1 matrix protein [Kamese virus]